MKRGKLDKDQLVTLFGMMSIAQAGVIPSAEAHNRAKNHDLKKAGAGGGGGLDFVGSSTRTAGPHGTRADEQTKSN